MTLYSIKVTKTVEKTKKNTFAYHSLATICTNCFESLKIHWPIILLLVFFSFFYFTYINLYNSDIGRHIANGREIVTALQQSWQRNGFDADATQTASIQNIQKLLTTNYYSYSEPEFPVVNHHWLFGVFAFLLQSAGNFQLLTATNLLLNTAAFGFILLSALASVQEKTFKITKSVTAFIAIVGFLLMPLLTNRTEVRPESLSLLFFSLYYFLFSSGLILRKKWLVGMLIGIQIIWTNSHLFFILGPLLVGYFTFESFLETLFSGKSARKFNILLFYFFLMVSLFAVSVLNPNGVDGLLAPVRIFDNYSYRVAENQSTFFMVSYGTHISFYLYFIICSILVLLIGVLTLVFRKFVFNTKISIPKKIVQLILVSVFLILANKINRMSPFLAVIAIPFVISSTYELFLKLHKKFAYLLQKPTFLMIVSPLLFFIFIAILKVGFFIPIIPKIGFGVLPNTLSSKQFFIENQLSGPIFNNYDVGGYLAYSLFPTEKVFLDNRPEAYSEHFLTAEYLAALTDETVWQHLLETYEFNVIFFYWHDQIDGAQKFLYTRITDSEWVPVFVDDYVLILVRNTKANKSIIEKLRLPQEMFVLNNT